MNCQLAADIIRQWIIGIRTDAVRENFAMASVHVDHCNCSLCSDARQALATNRWPERPTIFNTSLHIPLRQQ